MIGDRRGKITCFFKPNLPSIITGRGRDNATIHPFGRTQLDSKRLPHHTVCDALPKKKLEKIGAQRKKKKKDSGGGRL